MTILFSSHESAVVDLLSVQIHLELLVVCFTARGMYWNMQKVVSTRDQSTNKSISESVKRRYIRLEGLCVLHFASAVNNMRGL